MRLTERQTNGQMDRQNCDSNTVRCITCSHAVKTDEQSKKRKLDIFRISINSGYMPHDRMQENAYNV